VRTVRARTVVLVLAIAASACTGADPGGTGDATTPPSPAATVDGSPPEDSSPTPESADGALAGSADLTLGGAGSFRLDGTYPDVDSSCRRARQPTFEARYPGDLLVERGEGKTLRVIVTVPFDTYLEGIAEVPPTWPAAALDAQAIAARSYALARIGFTGPDGAAIETPICATAACQVYGGIPLEPVPGIKRWHAAVRRTDGRSLVFQGRPADAVYFSTSNGRTYGNDQVFGSSPLPYLRGITERDDGASPTSRWSVPLPYDDLSTFLSARGLWGGGRITRVTRRGDAVELRSGGRSVETIDEGSFREAVNGAAPCLFPGQYPTDSRFGSALPLTIPSRWYVAEPGRGGVDLVGRGWGHGVGMVQWGAYGKAQEGWTATQILRAYYGGLRPQPFPEPGPIRVLVAEGLTSLSVLPEAPGATFQGQALDDRVVRVEPGGDGVRVRVRRADVS
jgi:stage II sporulation protein D